MSVERERQLFEILDEALEREPRQREAFLDQACGTDAEMRREIEALLETEVEGGLLAEPMFSIHADDSGIGRQIGPYKLVRLLDRGGMGSVYLAEREDFEQQVALKLIRRGLDADDLMVRRFENERQILARLDHPNIARLLDGGTTDDRLPYFVMEYVEGVPIDRYCEDRGLSVEERLTLFRKVCSAVQFAHQNLVVHRDLKPSNILITSDGQPRLLDFGIAKLLDDSLAASAVQTVTGQAAMTPRYASPEQIQLRPVTTASDVYSLGVLLYELLTGLDPYGVDKRRSDEVARAVCETEPDRPSTAVRRRSLESEAAETRKLRRQLTGDLDSIVLKAMRKEPEQRYSSAEQLAHDIERHLKGLPVDAQTGTFRYRAGKFVRRHRLGMLVATAFLLLTGSLGLMLVQREQHLQQAEQAQQQVKEQQRQVKQQQRQTTALSNILEKVVQSADPDRSSGESITVLQALENAREQVTLEKDDEVRIFVARILGTTFRKLGAYDVSEEMMRLALKTAEEHYGENHPEIAQSLNNLGAVLFEKESYPAAEKKFYKVIQQRIALRMEAQMLFRPKSNLAMSILRQGRLDEAKNLCREVLERRTKFYQDLIDAKDTNHVNEDVTNAAKNLAQSQHNMAAILYAQRNFDEAEAYLRQALKTRRGAKEREQTKEATVLNMLGNVMATKQEEEAFAEAEDLYSDALEIREDRLPENHRDVARTRKNLAILLVDRDPVRAYGLLSQAIPVFDSFLPNGWDAAEANNVWGFIHATSQADLQRAGLELLSPEEAEALMINGYQRMHALRGTNTYRSRLALQRLIRYYETSGNSEELSTYRAIEEDLPD